LTDLRTAIREIGGKEPTPEQIQRIQAIAHSLGIAMNDPMLAILTALECYYGAFSAFPEKAQLAANAAAESAERQAKVTVDRAVREAIASDLQPAASQALEAVAHQVSGKRMFQWGAGAIIVASLCVAFTALLAYTGGWNVGKAAGYEQAREEKAAASWASTPQGKQAYHLAQAGSLDALVKCSYPGWQQEKGNCIPYAAKDRQTYGWKL
jgi:hypothetical protein